MMFLLGRENAPRHGPSHQADGNLDFQEQSHDLRQVSLVSIDSIFLMYSRILELSRNDGHM
jgi:hypothetical protein